MDHTLEYTTIAVYLVFLLGIGIVFARMNRNLSDYVRGGGQGTWWLVGMSVMMSGTSTNTFVGGAGAVYQAGLTPLVVHVAGILAAIIMAVFLAGWFRQTRAYTVADIYRERFGPEVEEFSIYVGVLLYPIAAAVMLLGLAIFLSSIFGYAVAPTILVIGIVVITYSSSGGKWAVMATDFFQGLLLIPICVLVAVLALQQAGGLSGLWEHFHDPALARDFQLVKDPGQFSGSRFDARWIAAIFISSLVSSLMMLNAGKYLSVKDGREARRAAWFSGGISIFNVLIFFIPPVVARVLYSTEVDAMPLKVPAESAYALVAMKVLPNGLLGVLVVAMLSATMSSMDTGLNGMAGNIVRNLLPALRRRFGRPEPSHESGVWTCRAVTIGLGVLIIGVALILAAQPKIELFDVFLIVSSLIGLPIAMPLFWGLFVQRLPRWSFFFIFGCSMLPPIWSKIDTTFFGGVWNYQDRIIWVLVAGTVGMLICLPFYRTSSAEYRDRVASFFNRMRTPIDFASEVGRSRDSTQLRLMGNTATAGGSLLLLLLLVPNDAAGRGSVLFVAGFVLIVGLGLRRASRRGAEAEEE